MVITKKEFEFKSSNRKNNIYAFSYIPEVESLRGAVQIIHGFAEHSGRYDEFAQYLCENGFAVYACDLLGHGRSVSKEDEIGYFADNDGWKLVLADIQNFTRIIKNEFPSIPLFLYGYGMGSLFVRRIATLTSRDYAGIILSGTYGKMSGLSINTAIVKKAIKKHGPRGRSNYLDNLFEIPMNHTFKQGESRYEWLTSDKDELKDYLSDPMCGFKLSCSMYLDLYTLIHKVTRKAWFRRLPKTMPILLISGSEDPALGKGQGIMGLYNKLRKTNHNVVTMKICEHARHNLLAERCKYDIMREILEWLNIYSYSDAE